MWFVHFIFFFRPDVGKAVDTSGPKTDEFASHQDRGNHSQLQVTGGFLVDYLSVPVLPPSSCELLRICLVALRSSTSEVEQAQTGCLPLLEQGSTEM